MKKTKFYETYLETQNAAIIVLDARGIPPEDRTITLYKRYRHDDPRLLAKPDLAFADSGWEGFSKFLNSGKEKHYDTYLEAQKAICIVFEARGIAPTDRTVNLYQKYRSDDPKLPAKPDSVYADTGWEGFPEFSKSGKEKHYNTYLEAQKAAIIVLDARGIAPEDRSARGFKKYRSDDLKLPANPNLAYAGSGWEGFFQFLKIDKVGLYDTYLEAQKAAICVLDARGIAPEDRIMSQYQKYRSDDPKLPANPSSIYANRGWESLYEFLKSGKERAYGTYLEAQKAAICVLDARGIAPEDRIMSQYQKYRSDDPKLPAIPNNIYADSAWKGFPEFLQSGKERAYDTYQEAQKAAISILKTREIAPEKRTKVLYDKYRSDDPRLPATPNKIYADRGWKDFPKFLKSGKERPYDTYLEAQKAAISVLDARGLPPEDRTLTVYQRYRNDDPKLSATPDLIYADRGWIQWPVFLSSQDFYTNEKDAFNAFFELAGLQPKTKNVYDVVATLDSKLPPNPAVYYGFKNWKGFIGVRVYNTLIEASEAALKIIPMEELSARGYTTHYKDDPKLPSKPYEYYKEEWISWDAFYGRDIIEKYNVKEAREVCVELKLFSDFEYRKYIRHANRDKRLPFEPVKYYKFKSFKEFIGLEYFTAIELEEYCHKNRITTLTQLKAINHPQIKKNVTRVKGYKTAKDILWQPSYFQALKDVGLTAWFDFATEYMLSIHKGIDKKQITIKQYLLYCIRYISDIEAQISVASFFDKNNTPPDIDEYLLTLAPSAQNQNTIEVIVDFLKYVFEKSFYIEGEDTGEVQAIPGIGMFRVPYLNTQIISGNAEKVTMTKKPDLPFEYVQKARDYWIPTFIEEDGNQIKCENFKQLSTAQEALESEWYDVDESLIDKNDKNCVFRFIEKDVAITGKRSQKRQVCQMWSPVKTVALFLLLNLPTRGQQILWLDSGEADQFKLTYEGTKTVKSDDGKEKIIPDYQWVENDNPLVGKHKKLGKGKNSPQGVLNKQDSEVGMFTNTNKTGKPFVSSYIPPTIIPWIIRLRDWQSKYNPLDAPTRWADIKMPTKTSDKLLKRRGTQCFLFRDPTGRHDSNGAQREAQPVSQKMYCNLLARVLYHIQDDDFPLAEHSHANVYISIYTPHCMRVSLITALVLYGDVPLEVLMQVVGHSQILMTLRYTKITHSDIVKEFEKADKKAFQSSAERKNALIIENKISVHNLELLIPENSGFLDPKWPRASIQFFDYGLCPYAGSRCSDGGELDEKGKRLPVVGGYLGQQNCFRCRHFITGPAYIGGLLTKCNEIAATKMHCSNQCEKIQKEIDDIDDLIYDVESKSGNVSKETTIKKRKAENQLESESTTLDSLACDIISIIRLSYSSLELLKSKSKGSYNKLPMVINSDEVTLSMSIGEASEQHALSEICENAELFTCGKSSAFIHKRTQQLDRLIAINKLPPTLFLLNEEEQLILGNQMTELMLARVGGWGRLDLAFEGEATLDQLQYENNNELNPLTDDVKALLSKPVTVMIEDTI